MVLLRHCGSMDDKVIWSVQNYNRATISIIKVLILFVVIPNVAAITIPTTSNIAGTTFPTSNFQSNYDAATLSGLSKATGYEPNYYSNTETADGSITTTNADIIPAYANYFSNIDTTGISRQQQEQLRLQGGTTNNVVTAATLAAALPMTKTGFVPTRLTAAGQHYAATTVGQNTQPTIATDTATSNHIANEYATSAGKINYEINAESYDSNTNYNTYDIDGTTAAALGQLSAMQHSLADGSSTNSDGNADDTYYENSLNLYKNYFTPTTYQKQHNEALLDDYGFEQYANYPAQHQPQQQPQTQPHQQTQVSEQTQSAYLLAGNQLMQQLNNRINAENYANSKSTSSQQQQQQHQHQQQQPTQTYAKQLQQQQQQKQTKLQAQLQSQQQLQQYQQLHRQDQLQKQKLQEQLINLQQQLQQQLHHQQFHQQQLQQQQQQTVTDASSLRQDDGHNVTPLRMQMHLADNMGRNIMPTATNIMTAPIAATTTPTAISATNNNLHVINNEKFADSSQSPSQTQYYYTRGDEISDNHNNNLQHLQHLQEHYYKHNINPQHINTNYAPQQHNAQHFHTTTKGLPPITTTVHHTPLSSAALAGTPLSKHVQVTKFVPIPKYHQVQVPFNQTVNIEIPRPVITTVPRPLPIKIPVTKTVAVPQIQEIKIPIEKIKPFPVQQSVPYLVEKRVPYYVQKQVVSPFYYPYPVKVPIIKTITHKTSAHHILPYGHYNTLRG